MNTAKNTIMEHKGFKARIMEAERLKGDHVHGLPPGTPLEIYPVDAFLKPPENWMKGPGVFVVPVKANKGLWFDWTMNSALNTAVIPTVKGCNPITGMQTSGFHMERYETKCPKHGCDFLAERFCPECGYKWPAQNYITGHPLWMDGWFNQNDGTVRQLFFTEDELRDIATAMIGKENTVPAFGFAFYSPKERRSDNTQIVWNNVYTPKVSFNPTVLYTQTYYSNSTGVVPDQAYSATAGLTGPTGSAGATGAVPCGFSAAAEELNECSFKEHFEHTAPQTLNKAQARGISKLAKKIEEKTSGGLIMAKITDDIDGDNPSLSFEATRKTELRCRTIGDYQEDIVNIPKKIIKLPVKEVSIGAGAKIKQDLNQDAYPLDSWRDAPDSVMTIYFVFQEKFEELKSGGMRDFTDVKEGMLSGLPVG